MIPTEILLGGTWLLGSTIWVVWVRGIIGARRAAKRAAEARRRDADLAIFRAAGQLGMRAELRAALNTGVTLDDPNLIRNLFLEAARVPDKDASDRALQVLTETLTPVQLRQWNAKRAFAVVGSSGGRYLIEERFAQFLGLDQGGRLSRYCAQPTDSWTPHWDRLLAWKLWLETDERTFLGIANVFPEESQWPESKDLRRAILSQVAEVLAERRPPKPPRRVMMPWKLGA